VTWSLLAVKVGTLNTHGVCTISLQAAVHPLTRPHTNKQTIIDSQTCPCRGGDQTTEHLIYHCSILETQREVMKNTIQKSGGKWPTSNKELIAKHIGAFTTFINSIDFEKLTQN
jgi:hypothetical protein